MDGISGAPFGFFAAGVSLSKKCGCQASEAEQEIKTRIECLWVVASELKRPPAKFEAQKPAGRVILGKLGSGRRVCGPPRGRGRPAGDQPGPILLWDRGELPPSCTSLSSSSSSSSSPSSSLGERRRTRDLHRGRGALDSPSVASESSPFSRSPPSSYSLESSEDTSTDSP